MTALPRSARCPSYPALMIFGLVYLMALAIVITPDTFRADRAVPDHPSAPSLPAPSLKETP